MLSALVDNSTLTAVQRLIGDIGVARSFPIEGDVSAFDQYIQSLLLYDEVAAIDDYKEEHRDNRKRRFNEIRFIGTEHLPYEEVSAFATLATESIGFQTQRGRLARDPMARFLRDLDLHVAPAWYMQSSSWYLQLRLLGEQSDINLKKYGALMSAIRSQVIESERSAGGFEQRIMIEDSEGRRVSMSDISNELSKFASGLSWMSQRALLYYELARRLNCALVLHPIRHSFLGQYAGERLVPPQAGNARKALLSFFRAEIDPVVATSDTMFGADFASVRLPFFAAWAVGYAGDPKRGYEHVLNIRDGPDARAFRSRFREIEALSAEGDFPGARSSLAKLHRAVKEDTVRLGREFGLEKSNALVDVSIDVITMSLKVSLGSMVEKASNALPTPSRRATTVLRSIARDVTRIPTLGAIADLFKRSRKIRSGTDYPPESPRVEPPPFERLETHFKRPL